MTKTRNTGNLTDVLTVTGGGGILGPTPSQFDNSTNLATTAYVQNSMIGVVGSSRNARMVASTGDSTTTFIADEVIVETALGMSAYRVTNINTSLNLATTGAGGMDAGTAPAGRFIAVYLIYNPVTQAKALLGTLTIAGTKIGEVYTGTNPVSGYTASALVGIVPMSTTAGQFTEFSVVERSVSILGLTLFTTTAAATLVLCDLTAELPANVKSIGGMYSISGSATSTINLAFYSQNTAFAGVSLGCTINTLGGVSGSFSKLPVLTPVKLWVTTSITAGTPNITSSIQIYDF